MTRIELIDPMNAAADAAEQLNDAKRVMGRVPNVAKAMANSPVTLKAYLGMLGALQGGVLSAAMREKIALAVSELNQCRYCLSAHTEIAQKYVKLSEHDVESARRGKSADPKEDALLSFAVEVASARGHVGESQLAELRSAGISDEEMAEVIGNVVVTSFTNYVNEAFDVEIDWPLASALTAS